MNISKWIRFFALSQFLCLAFLLMPAFSQSLQDIQLWMLALYVIYTVIGLDHHDC